MVNADIPRAATPRRAVTTAETDFILTMPWTSWRESPPYAGKSFLSSAPVHTPPWEKDMNWSTDFLPVVLILEVQQDQIHRPIISLKEPENIAYYVQMHRRTWEYYRLGLALKGSGVILS